MRSVGAVLLACGVLVCASFGDLGAAWAQEGATPLSSEGAPEQTLLEELQDKIETHTAELDSVRTSVKRIEEQLSSSRVAIAKLKRERTELLGEIEAREREEGALSEKIEGTKREIARLERLLEARVRALYMAGSDAPAALLLTALQGKERELPLMTRAYYLRRVRLSDEALARDLGALRERMVEDLASLTVTQEKQRALATRLAEEERALAELMAAQRRLLNEKKGEESRIEGAITAFRAQVLRLETVVNSLTGGTSDERERVLQESAEKHREPIEITPFDGGGLETLKGHLPRPVDAKVVRGYGRQRIAELKEYVFRKGVEYLASVNAEIKAVAPGRVLFAGRMPVYGIVVIVDHGQRFYSLYGRLLDLSVERGELLSKGEAIGRVGEASAPDEGNFYFELRKGGEPLNPAQFFAPSR